MTVPEAERLRHCGFVSNRSSRAMQTQRERIGDGWVPPWVRNEHLARFQFTAKLVRSKVVIDCACGDGSGTRLFAQEGAKFVLGVDLSAAAVVVTRKNASEPNLQLSAGSALQLPVRDRCADVFVALETIEHVDPPELFLREIRRVLTPEGIFICSTPNRTITNPGKNLGDRPWNRFHVREFNRTEFIELLTVHFDEVRLYGQNPSSPALNRVLNNVGRTFGGHLAVRLSQVKKLPRLLLDRLEDHQVQELRNELCEYLVAICLRPRRLDPRCSAIVLSAVESPST